jgi:hypothetical protein
MPTIRLDDGTEISLDEHESLILSWAISEMHDAGEKYQGIEDDFDILTSLRDKLRDANFGHFFRNGYAPIPENHNHMVMTLEQLQADNPRAELVYLTEQTIIELGQGLSVDCETVILVPPLVK